MKKRILTAVLLFCAVLLLFGSLVYASYKISIVIDGKQIESDVPPQLVQDRTMVPIRVITEHFGANVGWVQETMTVEITSPYQKYMDGYEEKDMYIKLAGEVLSMVNEGTAIVLDVRSDDLRNQGYILRSMHIPMSLLLDRIEEIPSDQAIAVYCVKNINAAYAVTILNMLGYEAYLLEGGMAAWREAGGRTSICRV